MLVVGEGAFLHGGDLDAGEFDQSGADPSVKVLQFGLEGLPHLGAASFDGHVALFNEENAHEPTYHQHNENGEDKVVFATFLHSSEYRGFASTSAQGLCHVYSYQ